MKTKLAVASLLIALGAGAASTAFAQAKPETLVEQRQAAMKLIGKYFGPVAGMAQGRIPYDGATVARNAGYLEALSQMPWDGFAASTSGLKSRALPAVYSDGAKFKQSQDQFQSAVTALVAASKGGDEARVKAAVGDVGKSCGGCHDSFREK
jgi:cytochrome c556